MATKLPKISFKQVGQNLNVIIDENVVTLKGTKEILTPVKEKLKAYLEKPTSKLLKEIQVALKPKETAKKVAKEKEVEKLKADIKLAKKKEKALPKVKKPKDDVESLAKKLKLKEEENEKLKKQLEELKNANKPAPAKIGDSVPGEH